MNILKHFWRYWIWVCTALVTTAVLLYVIAAIVTYFKSAPVDPGGIGQCIDSGGTWDEGEGACRRPA